MLNNQKHTYNKFRLNNFGKFGFHFKTYTWRHLIEKLL